MSCGDGAWEGGRKVQVACPAPRGWAGGEDCEADLRAERAPVPGRALGAGGGLWGGDTRSFPLFQFQLELGSSRQRPVVSTLLNGCAVQEGG